MTGIASLNRSSSALQALDAAELAEVDGGLGPLVGMVVVCGCGFIIGASLAVIAYKSGLLKP